MKIIIAGSRTFTDYEKLKFECEQILIFHQTTSQELEIITGGARGADSLGARFAYEKGWRLKTMPADWNKYGKSAGYRRNEDMAKYALEWKQNLEKGEVIRTSQPMLIAFWDGESKGTKHMIDIANKHNLKIHIIKY